MPKKTLREQLKHLAIFVVAKHPNPVSYRTVMFYMNCGATKARELCKTLAEAEPCFNHLNADIRFVCDPEGWEFETVQEDQ